MRCQKGDLAIVVRSNAGNEGKIVTCLRLMSPREADALSYWSGPLWEVDGSIVSTWRGLRRVGNFCPDELLRPLRDHGDDARDEMLRPLPQEVTA